MTSPTPTASWRQLDSDTITVVRRHALPVGVATLAISAVIVWRLGPSTLLPAYLVFAVLGCVLSATDLVLHRLPDAFTLPAYPAMAALLAYPAVLDPSAAERALLAAAVAVVFYFVGALAGACALGDVKAAGPIGALLGWSSWGTLVAGTFTTLVLAGLVGAVLLLTGRAGRKTDIPLGPFMYAGTLVMLLISG